MAGNPVARSKGQTVAELAPDFPSAAKPPGWEVLDLAAKLEAAFGCALDRAMDYLSWPPERCNPHMLAAQKEATRCMLNIGAKFGLERFRRTTEIEALERVARELGAALTPGMTHSPENGSNADLSADALPATRLQHAAKPSKKSKA